MKLSEPIKVDNEPIVQGEAFLIGKIKNLVNNVPKVTGIKYDIYNEENPGYYKYEIKCASEKIASSLAKLMRDVNL